MSGCFVTIFQISPLCLVIDGGSGLSPPSPNNSSGYPPVRSPALLRTRNVLRPLPEADEDWPLPPSSPLNSNDSGYDADDDVTVPYHFSPLSPHTIPIYPLAPEMCACIWPTLVSWCTVCCKQ